MLYELLPMMPEERLRPLVERFGEMLLGQRTFTEAPCTSRPHSKCRKGDLRKAATELFELGGYGLRVGRSR